MRIFLAILLASLAGVVHGQVTVNGKVPGELWKTEQVSGEVEVFHMLGRRTTLPVKEAWVNLDGEYLSVGAKCDQPIFEGKQQDGYGMVIMRDKISQEFPTEIQTIETRETKLLGEREIHTTRSAMIIMKDGKPESLAFAQVDYASFDVTAFIKELENDGSEMALRRREEMKAYDELGFRTRTFKARFQ